MGWVPRNTWRTESSRPDIVFGTDTHMPPAPRKSPTRRVPKQSRAERYVRGSSISSLWNALPCDGDEGVLGGARDAGGAAVLGQQLDRQKERERKADGGADAERLRGPSGPIGIVRPSSHGIEKEHEAERRRTDRRKAGARIAPQDRKTDEGGKDRHRAQPAEGGYRRGRRKKEAKARGRSERAAGRSELEQEQLENGRGRQEGPGADAAPLPTAPPADARQREGMPYRQEDDPEREHLGEGIVQLRRSEDGVRRRGHGEDQRGAGARGDPEYDQGPEDNAEVEPQDKAARGQARRQPRQRGERIGRARPSRAREERGREPRTPPVVQHEQQAEDDTQAVRRQRSHGGRRPRSDPGDGVQGMFARTVHHDRPQTNAAPTTAPARATRLKLRTATSISTRRSAGQRRQTAWRPAPARRQATRRPPDARKRAVLDPTHAWYPAKTTAS